jgi:uncharacterized membrane protein YecN with MAPEG domain
MPIHAAATLVALLSLFTAALAFHVSVGRFRLRIPHGEGPSHELSRRIRAHMNSVEHLVPVGLLLLSYALLDGDSRIIVAVGAVALLGRALLTLGILKKGAFSARRIGASLTYLVEAALAVLVLLRASAG